MREAVIRVRGLGKQYQIGTRESYKTLRDALSKFFSSERNRTRPSSAARQIWALRDVSFEIDRGDVLGVIGANGAGKSTLLKILSRITAPSTGSAEITGRVGSLLEVGTGFHHELTGRENIYLNGAIIGMRRAEIGRRFDEIIAFAGVEQFVDTPVKHYSSGMYLRLAFAVAAHLETEILMVDEVLAVGDASFQLRCLNKMSEVSSSGRTILFVSHNMEAVTRLCNRGLLLNEGAVARIGTPQECIDAYFSIAKDPKTRIGREISLRNHPGRTKQHNGPVQLTSLVILGEEARPAMDITGGRPLTIAMDYEVLEKKVHNVTFGVTISNFYNYRIATCRSHDTHTEPIFVDGAGTVICRIPKLPLAPGLYRLTVGCNTEAGHSDGIYDAATIEVTGTDFYPSRGVPTRAQGEVLFDHEWELAKISKERPA
jgi:lipopolysaccharide transport system ATP-binding protein